MQPPGSPTVLRLADAPIKQVLRLFAPEAPLHIRALGDTGHPSAGYVDEALVQGVTSIGALRAFPYDFAGLVHLDATVADLTCTYHDGHYQLAGPPKALQRVLAQLRALDAGSGAQPLLVPADF